MSNFSISINSNNPTINTIGSDSENIVKQLKHIYLRSIEGKGLGVFSEELIHKDEIIELIPVIEIQPNDVERITGSFLYNYYYDWYDGKIAIAMGYGSFYNHSYSPNAVYLKDFQNKRIRIKALSDIKPNEEILVNYNEDPYCLDKIWFDPC